MKRKGGFVLLPGGEVERSFGWLKRFRRLDRDYERLPCRSSFHGLRNADARTRGPSTSKFLTGPSGVAEQQNSLTWRLHSRYRPFEAR